MSTYSIKTNMENWKKIQGFEDYSVSDMGRVRRDTPGPGAQAGRILKGKINKEGYELVLLSNKGKKTMFTIHRLVAKAFIPNLKNLPEVNHLNGKNDNSVKSLEWSTRSDNVQHAYDNGLCRGPIGEKQGRSKLKEFQVLEIIDLSKIGLTQNEIKEKYGISQGLVSKILNKKTWSHI